MRTHDIGLAAYLSMCGVEPTLIECNNSGSHKFIYDDDEDTLIHVASYNEGVEVPVKQFSEARERMKQMRKAGYRDRIPYNMAASMRRRRQKGKKI
jgi:hypothetical protein